MLECQFPNYFPHGSDKEPYKFPAYYFGINVLAQAVLKDISTAAKTE